MLSETFDADFGQGPLAEETFAAAPAFRPVPTDDDLRAVLEVLDRAERPLLLAGGGARTSGAQRELLALAERLGLPVATSLTGKGLIDETHRLAVGVAGGSSRPSANRALAEADVVFVVGSHLGSQVTDGFRLPDASALVIQLDIDPTELGRNRPNAVSLYGDAREALRRMVELCVEGSRREDWLSAVERYVAEFRSRKADLLHSVARPIRPERLCREVTDALPDDAVLLVDTGHAGIWVGGLVDLRPTQMFLRAGGSLGWAYPASLGAKCALSDRPVVCFAGDGGLYYHLAELETAARYGINSVLVVNNNNSWSQDMQIYRNAFGGSDIEECERMWSFNDVDLHQVAEAMGCYAVRVEESDDIAGALAAAIASERPAVVEVVTDVSALPDPPHGGVDFYAVTPTRFDFYSEEGF
jgi:acetolactate synthase-1/2/3 large subunit